MGACEAVLLVGGAGNRLRPLTIATPKPMLPVAGVPFVAHQLARAHAAGVEHVVLATAYRPETFTGYLGDGRRLGLRIDYVTEREPLGTGGAIRNAAAALTSGPDEPVLIFNGDVLSGHDIAAQVRLHEERGADVTLHLTEVTDARAFGCVPTDDQGRVTAFLEKMPEPVTNRINAGCYVFRRRVIDAIPPGRVVSVERETFPGLLGAGALLLAYVDSSYWLDLGTPRAFIDGSRDLVLGRVDSPALPGRDGVAREVIRLDGAVIAPSASVGGGSTVGAGAVVEESAVVDGSVLLDRARVGAGAVVRDSVVGADARLAAGVVAVGAVIGDGAVVGEGNELRAGVRVWAGTSLPPCAVRFSSDR